MAFLDNLARTGLLYVAGICLIYTVYGVFWRLVLSPLAKYPGPKLAALTGWYETFYEIVLRGRFPWEVERLHDLYGIEASPEHLLFS